LKSTKNPHPEKDPVTMRVKPMSLDFMKLDGWSPVEIFPPVPYPHGLREVWTPYGIPPFPRV